jgi:hypothetical protein
MAAPGWYKDRGNPALARWFDGEIWTEDTVVIAEQPVGVRPAPPAGWTVGPNGFERIPEPQPEPEPPPAPEPPAPEPPAWAPPSRAPEPPAAAVPIEDDGPPTQPVTAVPSLDLRLEPGPASHLEELPPQGKPHVFQDLPPPDAPTGFRAPDFDPPDFEGPPPNRFAAMPAWLQIGVPLAILVVFVLVAIALL